MKKQDEIFFAIKNIISNKSNIIIIILLLFCSITFIFGFSYYMSLNNFWNSWFDKSYDFRLYNVTYDFEQIDESIMIERLKNVNGVNDVFTYPEFMTYGIATEFVNDNVDGEVKIWGTVAGSKKIIKGVDLSDNLYEIICPTNFLPKSLIQNGLYDSSLEINLMDKVNENLNIKLFPSMNVNSETKFKLVGVFDEKYDYSDNNICYTNHETIRKINEKYQPELFENKNYSLYILLDKNTNIDSINNISGVLETTQLKTIKKDIGSQVITITGILLGILYFLSFIIISLILKKQYENNYKTYSILLTTGYTREDIKNLNKCSILIIVTIVEIISAILSYFLAKIFVGIFLKNDMQLSKITINVTFLVVIINYILTLIILTLSNRKVIKNINKLSIIDISKG